MAALAGFYRRILPPPAVDFTCREGKELFREALEDGTMEGFFKLIANFQTQAEPAFCGLASLAVVLNSLAIDPGRKWKGPWRWFDESMLDCCEPLEKVKSEGITFAKVVCLAECSGAHVEAFPSNNASLDQFRQLLKECAASESHHMIASYNRQLLGQTGSGHFSPIGGYHEAKDMALILDVARFKYPPHWIPVSLLWDAVNTVDKSTGNWRGFMLVSKEGMPPSSLFTLSCRDERWKEVLLYLFRDLPVALKSSLTSNAEEVFPVILNCFPGNVSGFVKWIAELRRSGALEKSESQRLHNKATILQQLRSTELHSQLSLWLDSAYAWPSLSPNNLLDDISEAYSQGAALLNAEQLSCTCVQRLTDTAAVVIEQPTGDDAVGVLLPATSSVCGVGGCILYPSSADIFTILLFALPVETWLGVSGANFLKLLSTVGLPESLQREVEHLRRQLLLLRCSTGKLCTTDE